jgi:outer membrane protein OmpA-like peptidoglycan-associated protein
MKSERTIRVGRAAVLGLLLLLTASCSSTTALIVLLPDENHGHSAVAITQDDGVTVLDAPMTAARVDTRGRVEKEAITKAEVEKNFGEALATLPPKPISFTLYFEEGSTVLLEDSKNTLLELFAEVAKRQAVEVQVTGHTDTIGKESDNDRLSEERAQAVKKILVAQGLKSNFIRAVGRGSRELLIPTPPTVREPRNRRVEVIVR